MPPSEAPLGNTHSASPAISAIDLNLLRMLQAVLQTRSITLSGQLLGLSQPAASRQMAKLRGLFHDPLLTRTQQGYVLTPLALDLSEQVNKALAAAQAVFIHQQFDPATARRTFHIASTDYGLMVSTPMLSSALAQHAPHCTLHIHPWGGQTLRHLEVGELDLALYADTGALGADFHTRDLFTERYVLIARRNHPVLAVPTTDAAAWLQQMSGYPQVVARYPDGALMALDDWPRRRGVQHHHVAVSTPFFTNAPLWVAQSDRLMVLPERVAQAFAAPLGLAVVPLPDALADQFNYRMVWHRRSHKDQGLMWLRQQILSGFQK